jgi:hypothetical protein
MNWPTAGERAMTCLFWVAVIVGALTLAIAFGAAFP